MGSKGGSGFFHLFDWTWKSRKKLFTDGNASIEERIHGKVNDDDNEPASQLHLIDEDEKSGVSGVRDSSDHSCASSVADEEGSRIRAPGVVARLMGLDSMPTPGISEPYSTPSNDSRSLRDNPCQSQKYPSSYFILRSDVNSRKTVELRSEKMPSSPIEMFQVDALPPRLAKPISLTRHKLLSPVKSPGLISTKIFEPAHQKSTKDKIQSSRSLSPSKICDSRKIITTPQKTLKPSESSRGPVQSVAFKSSRSQPLGRSRNNLKNSESLPVINETTQAGANDKGKSVSLAIQAKLNVQRREGLSSNTRNEIGLGGNDEYHIDKSLKFQSIDETSNLNKGISGTDSSNILHQNKHNRPASKNKLSSKTSVSNQGGRNIPTRDANNVCYTITKGSEAAGAGKERFTLNNKNSCKKRLIEHGSYCESSSFVDNMPVDKQRKYIRHNVVIGDHSRWTNDNIRNGTDVVSFTFTSPLAKPVHGSLPPSREREKIDKMNGYNFNPYSEIASGSDGKSLSSLKLNAIKDDHLGILLELKLRELASRIRLPYPESVTGGSVAAPVRDLRDLSSTSDVTGIASSEYKRKFLLQSFDDEARSGNSNCSVTSAQVPCMRHKLQEVNKMDCYCSIVGLKEPTHQDRSPISILEKSFSNDSCYSSESFENADASRIDSSSYSSAVSEDIVEMDCMNKTLSVEPEMELSDSASSYKQVTDVVDLASEIRGIDHTVTCWDELEYVKEILTKSGFIFDDLILYFMDHSCEILDPLLFEKLEENQSLATCEVEENHRRMRRKVIFDAVNECLDTKYSHYFRAGFRIWAKGAVFAGKDLAQELYNEIWAWTSNGEWMVDVLVDKDMSTRLGTWIDYELEAFEAGVEIQMWLFDILVDEIFADF